MKQKSHKRLTHDEKLHKCEEFLKNFEDYDIGDVAQPYEQYGRRKYMIEMVLAPSLCNEWPTMGPG